ncbi:helix-turn-helix domain-containing protein [Rufibacter quisquiliarum]|uniref:Helix-turn-helix domain-containing protein n=1 Tax=Rufibacter quisquiliarum TaxID=1549639 RepID=A0A839GHJ5_9BACT|nr:helix-turn-helix domain-containing protein [Rufibacter quisquiliarum]MBA9077113.1 hypothetical protein [Rufibacter quisquiliarum]
MVDIKRPSNKSVLPAAVRFDERLLDGEKLLNAEIVALCGRNGFCWPKNKYLAELYGKTTKTISRGISKLSKLGYVEVKVSPLPFDRREIHLLPLPGTPESGGLDTQVQGVGHPCSQSLPSLYIGKMNDNKNDKRERGTPARTEKSNPSFAARSVPTVDQVRQEMGLLPAEMVKDLDLTAESQMFHNYYQSKGWMVGLNEMRDMHAAVKGWILKAHRFNHRKDADRKPTQGRSVRANHDIPDYQGTGF